MTADMVIGSRVLGKAAKGSLTPQQRFGNGLATLLLRLLYERNVHGPRPLPRHTLHQPAAIGHGRPQLWLDSGDAGEGRQAGPAQHGGAGGLPRAHRPVEGVGHGERYYRSGIQDPAHHFQIRLRVKWGKALDSFYHRD
jgi:hypothetical protein